MQSYPICLYSMRSTAHIAETQHTAKTKMCHLYWSINVGWHFCRVIWLILLTTSQTSLLQNKNFWIHHCHLVTPTYYTCVTRSSLSPWLLHLSLSTTQARRTPHPDPWPRIGLMWMARSPAIDWPNAHSMVYCEAIRRMIGSIASPQSQPLLFDLFELTVLRMV